MIGLVLLVCAIMLSNMLDRYRVGKLEKQVTVLEARVTRLLAELSSTPKY